MKKFASKLDFRFRDCLTIGKATYIGFVIPGLARNPLPFQSVTLLDAGSVITDLIRDGHDRYKSMEEYAPDAF
jgi:hypothetical protein